MLDEDKLLQLLNQPGIKSGTSLGDKLGVSRMAVQKRIQAFSANGLPVEAVPSKGYRLANGVSVLNKADIRLQLNAGPLDSIEIFQSIASTNSHLLSQPIAPQRARACLAEVQTAGRGRRGNDWQSAPYRNIMMSLSWGFSHWPETITGLGLAVALAVAERLNAQFDIDVRIKWPNDLLVGDAKLAGILIDVAGESGGACNVVVGLGLNVHQPDWSQQPDYRWTDLSSLGVYCDRNVLVGTLLNDLMAMLSEFEASGFASMVERWNQLSSYDGLRVAVNDSSGSTVGLMQGVDAMGALLIVDDAGEVHRFADSTVSVRLFES